MDTALVGAAPGLDQLAADTPDKGSGGTFGRREEIAKSPVDAEQRVAAYGGIETAGIPKQHNSNHMRTCRNVASFH